VRLVPSFSRANGLAAAAGALLPLSFAPFGAFWLAPLLIAGLFALWEGQSPRAAAERGFCFGITAFGFGTYWTYISVHGFGGTPVWLALILSAALILANAAHVALAGWLAGRCRVSAALRWCLAWPAAWLVAEWLRSWMLTGFRRVIRHGPDWRLAPVPAPRRPSTTPHRSQRDPGLGRPDDFALGASLDPARRRGSVRGPGAGFRPSGSQVVA
jgi:hypothetical protein